MKASGADDMAFLTQELPKFLIVGQDGVVFGYECEANASFLNASCVGMGEGERGFVYRVGANLSGRIRWRAAFRRTGPERRAPEQLANFARTDL